MKRLIIMLLATMVTVTVLLMAGNASAADWRPEKDKAITMYVPSGAGGASDQAARTLTQFLGPELGTKFIVYNRKPVQSSYNEFLKKTQNDGYTVMLAVLGNQMVYLDRSRNSTYSAKDLEWVMNYAHTPMAISVKKGSAYRSLKDLVEAARANPNKIKVTASGPMNMGDMSIYNLEMLTGVKFAHVIYNQEGEQRAALLGGHMDAESNPVSEIVARAKSGEIEILAVFDNKRSEFVPDVKTAEEQGYKSYMSVGWGLQYKKGIPVEIKNGMIAAVKRATAEPECQALFKRMSLEIRIIVGQDYLDYWNGFDKVALSILNK